MIGFLGWDSGTTVGKGRKDKQKTCNFQELLMGKAGIKSL